MAHRGLPDSILTFLQSQGRPTSAAEITEGVQIPRPTVNRALARLVRERQLSKTGKGPALRYVTAQPAEAAPAGPRPQTPAEALRVSLSRPLGTRTPVSYDRSFVDGYMPNESSLLPSALAQSLYQHGRAPGQQPAGTVARKVLEQLLIDLSWYSSRLEGNRKSLLDTRELFVRGRSVGDDPDTTMLLNHKEAIEFTVDAVPAYGITVPVVRNIQSLLMQGLLANTHSLGAIRRTVVNITGTVYVPTQVPSLLEEMLGHVVEKARSIKNPVEAAFFLWVNLAYLQPFEAGNKRTSRLCANLPLMLSNCPPLSFLDVETTDYAMAMLGVYERLDLTLATELFDWTYRRSIPRYRSVIDSLSTDDSFIPWYRGLLGAVVR